MNVRTHPARLVLHALLIVVCLLALPGEAWAQGAGFTNPIVRSRDDSADPWIVFHEGYYYFTFTAGDRIEIWKSPTITGIDRGTKRTVWRAPARGPQCCNVWAPELHFIGDRWYIYYAADDGRDENHRMYVLESLTHDPQGEYIDRGKIAAPTDRWAIDGSVLRADDGSLYFVWSGWQNFTQGPQNLYIAPMSNPWTISGERVMISAPANTWERVGWWVNEGPVALRRDGKTFIVYSASGGSTPDYCLGMLTNTTGNLLDPGSWVKSPGCVFARTDTVFGPGHNSFVKSADGTEDWIIYHARDTPTHTWANRTARAQPFTWSTDGTPNFGNPVASSVALSVPAGEGVPVLLTVENSDSAVAFDSVTMMRDPFHVSTTYNFSQDRRTRISLFAANVFPTPAESTSDVVVRAEDAQGRTHQLPTEYAGRVAGFSMTQVVVRLPDELAGAGVVRVSLTFRGTTSNKVAVNIR